MRVSIVAAVAFSALVAANNEANAFNNPPGGYQFTAGKPTTLTWNPDTTGSVSLRLQSGSVSTPNSGDVIADSIGNSGSYTWHVPENLVANQKYTIEIIDDSDSNEYNFLPPFTVAGATGSAPASSTSAATTSEAATTTSSEATTSTSASSSSASSSSSSSSSSTVASTSASSTSASSTSASSTSASSSSASTMTTSASSSTTASSSPTPTASSSTAPSSTASESSVPTANAGVVNGVSGGMLAMVAGVFALL
ncbi:cell wall protein [Penicillium chermesinum]|uniref:Cell wall protein n=1 Tax=Penicillium chermesinum TaxID=63820 RepID=A0A9W9PHL0_9EURO|nr:cell wall protein [Penicillium chermesinum]KAJ5247009.1 cell wall protein [Penicillium chermesinum]KAJ6145260.1 cell wall protein [Penicillium chermesinum]